MIWLLYSYASEHIQEEEGMVVVSSKKKKQRKRNNSKKWGKIISPHTKLSLFLTIDSQNYNS